MQDLKAFSAYFFAHPLAIAATLLGATGGAFLGALAYYRGWLG